MWSSSGMRHGAPRLSGEMRTSGGCCRVLGSFWLLTRKGKTTRCRCCMWKSTSLAAATPTNTLTMSMTQAHRSITNEVSLLQSNILQNSIQWATPSREAASKSVGTSSPRFSKVVGSKERARFLCCVHDALASLDVVYVSFLAAFSHWSFEFSAHLGSPTTLGCHGNGHEPVCRVFHSASFDARVVRSLCLWVESIKTLGIVVLTLADYIFDSTTHCTCVSDKSTDVRTTGSRYRPPKAYAWTVVRQSQLSCRLPPTQFEQF